MRSKPFIAFILNLVFAVVELIGGLLTGSVAILSDALHDTGDAMSIGVSCLLERVSRRPADGVYTYGYRRFSVLGSVFTGVSLLMGSAVVVWQAIGRLWHPQPLHSLGMIGLAVFGVVVQGASVLLTKGGESLNLKTLNLHLLEDLLGWLAVLVGGAIIALTGYTWIDPVISLALALYIAHHAVEHLGEALAVFLDRAPIDTEEIAAQLAALEGVEEVRHLHIRSLDGVHHRAEVQVVTAAPPAPVRQTVKDTLASCGIEYATVEIT